MGLPILVEKMEEIRKKNPTVAKRIGFYSIATMVCLDEFLNLLAARPEVLRQFKTLLQNLIVIASASLSSLQLVVAQLETATGVVEHFIRIFKNAQAQTLSSISPFPFSNNAFANCPPIQYVKKSITNALPKPDPASLLPGNAKKVAKKYKQATQSIKEMEYRVFKYRLRINELKTAIETIRLSILGWQAIVDAIGAQFGV